MKLRKLVSIATATLLAAASFAGLATSPANAAAVAYTTFEANDSSGYSLGGNNDFGGVGSSVVALSSTGTTAGSSGAAGNVGKVDKPSTATFWGGTTFSVLTGKEFISAADKTVELDIYTNNAVTVKLKLESSSGNLEQNISSSGAGWQHVIFDFTNPFSGTYSESNNYSTAVIFFNFDDDGAGHPTQPGLYYFDNVSYTQALTCSISGASTLANWETTDTSGATPTVFGGATASVENAPAGSYVGNVSALKITKPVGAQVWAGVTILDNSCMNYANSSTVTANVYTTYAGMGLTLKLEGAGGTATEIPAASPLVSGWQVVTWSLTGIGNQRTKVSLFPDLTVAGAGKIVYVDDIAFNGATTPALTGGGSQPNPTVDYDVRLQSSLKDTNANAYQWTSCGGNSWCANNNYYMKMIAAGASTTLSYVVTVHGTSTVVANATVHLRINTAYSGSNATWSSGGTSYAAVSTSSGSDAGFITGTTDGSGQVSFTFTNTNTTGEAARTLNNANPYPSGCNSPEGQTKAALQPEVTAVSGSTIGNQYVDVLWPHISSLFINNRIAAGSDGTNCVASSSSSSGLWTDPDNKGNYPHIRLDKGFLDTKFDASWWDGVWQYRDADTKAYLKYIPVGSTFKLTYTVTGPDNLPLADTPVTLIVNANYACAKTYFMYENSLIGPDDCSGGGETALPAKKTDGQGRVSFVLTNTNAVGEAMPTDLNGLPNGKEIGTNIKPHLVGATKEGIDMLFAHFVQPTDKSTVTAPSATSVAAGQSQWSSFTFMDESGKPMANTEVSYMINGFSSKAGYAVTDSAGKVLIRSSNPTTATGKQVVAVSLIRPGKLPLTGSTVVNWISPTVSVAATGAKGSVVVDVLSAKGKAVKISVAGKVYNRTATSDTASFTIPATAGAKKVVVTVGTKTVTKTVTVAK